MSVLPTKRELFDVKMVMSLPKPTPNRFLNLLDNRIGDFALKFIGTSTLTLGSGIAISAVVLLGLSAMPIVLVVSLIGIGVTCFYVRSYFKNYHNTQLLNQYKKEALEVHKSYAYLDKVDFIQGNESQKADIKKHLLRPLTIIIAKHERLENIFNYKLLDVKAFKEAFDLEIKYLSFPEAFAFYEEVIKALDNTKAPKFAELDAITPNKEFWVEKFLEYVNQQESLFDIEKPLNYEEIKKSEKVMSELFDGVERLFKLEYLPLDKQAQFVELKKMYLENVVAYSAVIKEGCSFLIELEKIKFAIDKKYESHRYHQSIASEQQEFLKGIVDVQKKEEMRVAELDSKLSGDVNPICMRNGIFEGGFDMEKFVIPGDKELYEWYIEKYKKDKANIEKECAGNLQPYMEAAMLQDFVDRKQFLKEYRRTLDESYKETVESPSVKKAIRVFMGKYNAPMLAFRNQLIGFYEVFKDLNPPSSAANSVASA